METARPLLAVLAVLAAAAAAEPLVHCPRDDRLGQCVGEAFLRIIRSMATGDPGHGVPKLDPILVPLMPMSKNAGKVLNLNMTFFNLTIEDITHDVTLKSAKFDYDKLEATLELHRPLVHFHGSYKINGKILWLPIWGEGTSWMKMTDVGEVWHMRAERAVAEDGRPYMQLKEYTSTLSPGAMAVHYDNLFGGNWVLGQGANTLINSQWKVIYQQLQPLSDGHFSAIMRPYWADIFKQQVDLDRDFPAPAAAAAAPAP